MTRTWCDMTFPSADRIQLNAVNTPPLPMLPKRKFPYGAFREFYVHSTFIFIKTYEKQSFCSIHHQYVIQISYKELQYYNDFKRKTLSDQTPTLFYFRIISTCFFSLSNVYVDDMVVVVGGGNEYHQNVLSTSVYRLTYLRFPNCGFYVFLTFPLYP